MLLRYTLAARHVHRRRVKGIGSTQNFNRRIAYFVDRAVGSVRQASSVFRARVRGTETCRISLKIRATSPPVTECDLPYDYEDACKHGIALGFTVLDLMGDDDGTAEPEPDATSNFSKAEKLTRILNGAYSRTNDTEKLAFLRQLLAKRLKQLRWFLETFKFDEEALVARLPRPPIRVQFEAPWTLTEKGRIAKRAASNGSGSFGLTERRARNSARPSRACPASPNPPWPPAATPKPVQTAARTAETAPSPACPPCQSASRSWPGRSRRGSRCA